MSESAIYGIALLSFVLVVNFFIPGSNWVLAAIFGSVLLASTATVWVLAIRASGPKSKFEMPLVLLCGLLFAWGRLIEHMGTDWPLSDALSVFPLLACLTVFCIIAVRGKRDHVARPDPSHIPPRVYLPIIAAGILLAVVAFVVVVFVL